ARDSLLIACDFPAYYFLYRNDLYELYKRSLEEASLRTNANITLLVPNATERRRLMKDLYPLRRFDELRKKTDFLPKLRLLGQAVDKPEATTVEDFYDSVELLNQTAIEQFDFVVEEVPQRIPIFGWVADKSRATFAIPTHMPGDDGVEHAFRTRDKGLVRALDQIFRNYVVGKHTKGPVGKKTKKKDQS
ncbi:MAG: hypothetical protein WBD31_00995, partial [Rubripirellula sp.]